MMNDNYTPEKWYTSDTFKSVGDGFKGCIVEMNRQDEVTLSIQITKEQYRTQTIDKLAQRFDGMSPDEFNKLCISLNLAEPLKTEEE